MGVLTRRTEFLTGYTPPPPPITFRSAATVAVGSRTNTTGSAPAGTTSGDVLVAFHSVGDAGDTTPPAVTGPSGWTEQSSAIYGLTADNYAVRLTMWTALHTVSDFAWLHSAGSSTLRIGCYSGANTTTPMDVTPSSAATALTGITTGVTATAPSITTVTANTMLVIGRGSWDGNAITAPSGWTEQFDNTLVWTGEKAQAATGATGTVDVGSGNVGSSSPWGIIMAAIRPA